MDQSKKGVVYFSLGSITSTKYLPANFIRNLIKAMETFVDYQFIMKIDENDLVSHLARLS
jgi:hypothetical protein